MVLSAVSNDAVKSIKIRIEEIHTEFGKMVLLGELNKSNLTTVLANNVALKWIEERMWGEEMVREHNVTSLRCICIMQKSPISKNEMPKNREHVNYSIS